MESILTQIKSDKATTIWREVLNFLQGRITHQAYETWFSETEGVAIKDSKLIVEVPNEFYIDWLEEHYAKIILEALTHAKSEVLKVIYRPAPKEEKEIPKKLTHYRHPDSQLIKRYTFSSFVTGKSNEFAYAACKAVAESPARAYNPLFIYGGVGLGKTHLLQAVGNHVSSHVKVSFTPAETFMNEMVRAIQTRNMVSFKLKYRQLDILLIDDVQFLADKEMLQEEIFHTFNSLYDAGRQIVMTSDRPPKEIPALEERLVSRFQWGLVADIQPPDLETRMAILKKKAEEDGVSLSDGVIHCIAQKVKKNIRELEGCLVRLAAFRSLINKDITTEFAEEVLRDMFRENIKENDIDEIIETVAQVFAIPVKDIKGDTRKKEIVEARHAAMYLAKALFGVSLKKIGSYFGGRDHSTIIHSIRKATLLVEKDKLFAQKIERTKEKFRPV